MFSLKWIGAILVIASCSGCGFSIAAQEKLEEHYLRQIKRIILYMESQLAYQVTPLPKLVSKSAEEGSGVLKEIFSHFGETLSNQVYPDASSCLRASISIQKELPRRVQRVLRMLGASLGRFDLDGQLKGLQSVRNLCDQEIDGLRSNRDNRLRCYRTLGISAGVSLAILFI